MVIGGLVAGRYGWRGAFLVAGAPGLLLAVLVHFFYQTQIVPIMRSLQFRHLRSALR